MQAPRVPGGNFSMLFIKPLAVLTRRLRNFVAVYEFAVAPFRWGSMQILSLVSNRGTSKSPPGTNYSRAASLPQLRARELLCDVKPHNNDMVFGGDIIFMHILQASFYEVTVAACWWGGIQGLPLGNIWCTSKASLGRNWSRVPQCVVS